MKKISLLVLAFIIMQVGVNAQVIGDTVTIESFNYTQTYGVNQWSGGIRDTIIDFSVLPDQPIEKVLMLYNMRCKNNLVSNSGNPDQGCGEWDISCNTYLHDSTRTDSLVYTHPNYIISNFSGTTFDYTSQAVYDLWQFEDDITTLNNIISESSFDILNGYEEVNTTFNGSNKSGKSQYLYTADELISAGFSAGEIDGLMIDANNTGTIHFLRVKLKTTMDNELSPDSPVLDSLTQVFFDNEFTFQSGNNRLQFNSPFDWNGTDNLIVEFSFTNSTPTTDVQIKGSPSAMKGISTNNGYHIDLSNNISIDVPTDGLSSIQDEITVSFWAYGKSDMMPTNTSLLEADDSLGHRTLNFHLPWSNSNIYFDCGNIENSYDRINKAASQEEYEGQWNHWAFTKNSDSGVMKIYHNGEEWHSGEGKTNPINIFKMLIGGDTNGNYNFKGYLDELRIWDKELAQTEINNWKNIKLDESHPNYSNLITYLKMDEGNDSLMTDESDNAVTAVSNSSYLWEYTRGNNLSRFFKIDNYRPNISLLRGDYDTSIVQTTFFDSIARQPKQIKGYDIIFNSGSMLDDEVSLVFETYLWEASEKITYEASTGNILSSTPIASEGNYAISNLEYQRRFPAKIEIMSFVTPYGLGLDLGENGKTWTFDLTDYLPIFKGQKRMTMERGGQWMEDMDIKFLFILGTPPRDVIGFNQIWRPESRSYTSLENDQYFAPREIYLNPDGKFFKIRSSVTGHGQEGEFIPREHYININGGNSEFNWQVWKECAENPIYPQGGTWIYDRAGWCPGSPTDIQHFDITPLVNPGENTSIDYGVLNASGTSNYIINNQLITYGNINHALDASVIEVREPSNRVEFSRFNSICHTPKVVIKNTGETVLTSLKIKYWVNNSENPLTHNWTGNLEFGETEIVELQSSLSLWQAVNASGNIFHVSVEEPNGDVDEYQHNNTYHSSFDIPEMMPEKMLLFFKTNNTASETSWKVLDSENNIIYSRSNMSNNTLYRDTIELEYGCYRFIVEDTDDDGIDFWANNDGEGYCRIYELGSGMLKNFESDFGDNINFNFTVGSTLVNEEFKQEKEIFVYPNPAKTSFIVECELINEASITIYDNLKRRVDLPHRKMSTKIEFDTSDLAKGLYLIQIQHGTNIKTKKVIID